MKKYFNKAVEEVGKIYSEGSKKILIIAIDGKSGSGKTTLAGLLRETYGGNVFHMDDFFLRPEQRTEARMSEIGGNVDYERFYELLKQIKLGKKIGYQPYNCHTRTLIPSVLMEFKRLNIVEGSYSMHPYFGNIYDYKITLDIEAGEQKNRIRERNGTALLRQFEIEWIPKENAYLEQLGIYQKSDLNIKI